MVVGDEVKCLAPILPVDCGAHHAEIIADMGLSGGLDSRKDARLGHGNEKLRGGEKVEGRTFLHSALRVKAWRCGK